MTLHLRIVSSNWLTVIFWTALWCLCALFQSTDFFPVVEDFLVSRNTIAHNCKLHFSVFLSFVLQVLSRIHGFLLDFDSFMITFSSKLMLSSSTDYSSFFKPFPDVCRNDWLVPLTLRRLFRYFSTLGGMMSPSDVLIYIAHISLRAIWVVIAFLSGFLDQSNCFFSVSVVSC